MRNGIQYFAETKRLTEDVKRSSSQQRDYHFHGRRKGHALRPAQKALLEDMLPALRIDAAHDVDVSSLFARPCRGIWLEVGFGGGEHLIHQARANPDACLIGAEPYVNGIAKALAGIRDHGLSNIRLYDDDVRDLLPRLATNSLDRAFILFPDPWPKTRHRRRRIVSADVVNELARLLKPGSVLRLASDIDDYVDWMLRHVAHHPAFAWTARHADDWRQRPADWPQTRYEAKALREGREPAYLEFVRS